MESLMTAQNLPAEDSSDSESDAEEDNWWTKSNKENS